MWCRPCKRVPGEGSEWEGLVLGQKGMGSWEESGEWALGKAGLGEFNTVVWAWP